MASDTSLTCYKCGKEISKKDYITCMDCGYHFHLDCTSIGDKLFYLMTSDTREKCKCDNCRYGQTSNKIQINIPTENSFSSLLEEELSMINEQDSNTFVTQRRNRKNTSLPDLSAPFVSIDSSLQQKRKSSNSSLVNSTSDNLSVMELKLEIKRIQTELDIANNEIEKLNNTNTKLNKKNQEQEKIIKLYEKNTCIDYTYECERNRNKVNSPSMSTPLRKHKNIVSRKDNEPNKLLSQENMCLQNEKSILPSEINKTNTTNNPGRKLCLITSTSQDRKSSKLREHFARRFSCCHYRTPGGGIEQLSDGLQEKLKDFTIMDYCIIMVGESDFNISKNYQNIVTLLKQRLNDVQHTNIIVCLPTFKCKDYCNLFNKRVELFNDMLYRDNEKNEYCYILDSNNSLDYYSNEMFSQYSGKLNLNGLKTVLCDLDYLMFDIIVFNENNYLNNHHQNNICKLDASPESPVFSKISSFRT